MNILILSGVLIDKPQMEIIEPGIKVCHGIIAVGDVNPQDYEYYLFISFGEEAEKIYKKADKMIPVQFKGELKNYNYTVSGIKKYFSCVHVSESEFGISFCGGNQTAILRKSIDRLKMNEEKISAIDEYWKRCLWNRERKYDI